MKVLLLNSSPHKDGCTALALSQAAKALEENGIDTETVFIGKESIPDCKACGACFKLGKCVIEDCVNEFVTKAAQSDGFIFGSPVYYAHPTGHILSFLDRAFFSGKDAFMFKPGAAVLVARRAGCTASMDVINKYFTISSMPVVSATYWNQVYGGDPAVAGEDLEGISTIYNLGKNMAWLLKCIDLGKTNGLPHPENEKIMTNFIR